MNIENYIEIVSKRLQSGISGEHTYRGDLETLIRTLVPQVEITNEPLNVTDCGNPDYVITKGKIPIGYIEAKDIGKDLNSKLYKEQFGRYKKALDNLIITDYIWFQFFQNGELIHEIKIGEIDNNTIKPIPENYDKFENLIKDFCSHIGQTIKSSKKLAQMMAGKARLLQNILERAITSDEETQENTSLKGQYDTFKEILIHDLKPKGFADIYAQTLAYGMFAARLHDTSLDDFSRQEAAELIPKSNPFLRKLFGYVAGPDIDERIVTVVDNLAEVFRATNVDALLHNFGKSTQTNDPIIHFYETFLSEYDPKLRKARGVWYTPEPVVNFIVRAVDEILKTEFNLPQGLADTTKTKIKVKTDIANKKFKSGYKEVEKEVHKVQILDPATGTGTFLAEVVKFIYNKNFKSMQGAWSGYVEEHLIPRLNGFELLMASYAMAHLKLDMLLTETGYKSTKNQRLNVYLTNSLEEHHPDTGTLFSNWLSSEANEANHIKRDTPVMCVIGNPPYSGISSNKGKWIMDLMQDYKKEPGGKEKLKERNPKMINDDYVKFIRYSQYHIEKNGEGILAFINPHGYLDNATFRGMRWNLLKTFNKVYVIDLNGSVKKKKTGLNGENDQNVFDITTGVSINIFIKKKSHTNSEVNYVELLGHRNDKYLFLKSKNLKDIIFKKIDIKAPNYFMNYKDNTGLKEYEKGLEISKLFSFKLSGLSTKNDKFCIKQDKNKVKLVLNDLKTLTKEELTVKYHLKETSSWSLNGAINDVNNNYSDSKIIELSYRPFDNRYSYYTGKSMGFMGRPKGDLGKHLLNDNLCIVTVKKSRSNSIWNLIGISNKMICEPTTITSLDGNYGFPLYLYPDQKEDGIFTQETRKPNLNLEIVNQIAQKLGLSFTNEKENLGQEENNLSFAPIDLLDYIYAVLHSPTYREKYKEFLKIDFPRVPYPKDVTTFWQLVKLGGEIREIHLLESASVENYITNYPKDGDNVITTKIAKKDWELTGIFSKEETKELGYKNLEGVEKGRIWINETQYFDNIPLKAWEFYIGGYQPAQKWLKDRKQRTLKFEDILHYQKIIVALTATDRIMQEIDEIIPSLL